VSNPLPGDVIRGRGFDTSQHDRNELERLTALLVDAFSGVHVPARIDVQAIRTALRAA
jgi:hypothetical protein